MLAEMLAALKKSWNLVLSVSSWETSQLPETLFPHFKQNN